MSRMVLKRVEPMSVAKVLGALAALIGLIIGFFMSLASCFASGLMGSEGGMFGAIFGIGAIILMPLLYGFFGFIGGLIEAFLYNFIAERVGGIEMEFE